MWALFMMPPAFSLFYLPLLPSSLSLSHHHHHHILCEGSAPASCPTITSPNPPPSVCISAVLIAPETQSNGQEVCAGVQLTGSPLSLSWYLFHIRPFSSLMWSLLLTLTLCSVSPLTTAPESEWATCPDGWKSCLLPGCSHCRTQHQQTRCWWGRATQLTHAVHTTHLPVPHGEER